MKLLNIPRALAEAHWQAVPNAPSQARLFSRQGAIFAVSRVHECQLPLVTTHLEFHAQGRTTEYGQRLFVGLMTLEPLTNHVTGPGLGVSIDPETGAVEDLLDDNGVVGYMQCAPQENDAEIALGLEAWIYGSTFIPRLRMGSETLVLPALLVEPRQTMVMLIGGELGTGALPRIDYSELTLRPLSNETMAHG